MGFEFSIWMLVPAVFIAIGLWAALNREKLRKLNLRHESMLRHSRFPRRSDHDPTGKFNAMGGAGMALVCVLVIIAMGLGWMDV